jgi:hypothetical protein
LNRGKTEPTRGFGRTGLGEREPALVTGVALVPVILRTAAAIGGRVRRRKDGGASMSALPRILVTALVAAVVSCLFFLSYGYATHAPRPHDVRIEVVGANGAATRVNEVFDRAVPGGFDVEPAADEAAAHEDVATGKAYGAIIDRPIGPVGLLTASASGLAVQQIVTRATTAYALVQRRAIVQKDVVPLPPSDAAGVSAFFLQLGLLIPGLLVSVLLYLIGRRSRVWARISGAVVYALCAAALGVLVMDTAFGALTGAAAALFGISVLAAMAFVVTVAALQAAFGLPGTAVAAAVLLIVGNPVNGVTVAAPLLPDGYRQIASAFPNNATVRAIKDQIYFGGQHSPKALLILSAWIVGGFLIIGIAGWLHLRQRRRAEHSPADIYAKPIIGRRLPTTTPNESASPMPDST